MWAVVLRLEFSFHFFSGSMTEVNMNIQSECGKWRRRQRGQQWEEEGRGGGKLQVDC